MIRLTWSFQDEDLLIEIFEKDRAVPFIDDIFFARKIYERLAILCSMSEEKEERDSDLAAIVILRIGQDKKKVSRRLRVDGSTLHYHLRWWIWCGIFTRLQKCVHEESRLDHDRYKYTYWSRLCDSHDMTSLTVRSIRDKRSDAWSAIMSTSVPLHFCISVTVLHACRHIRVSSENATSTGTGTAYRRWKALYTSLLSSRSPRHSPERISKPRDAYDEQILAGSSTADEILAVSGLSIVGVFYLLIVSELESRHDLFFILHHFQFDIFFSWSVRNVSVQRAKKDFRHKIRSRRE